MNVVVGLAHLTQAVPILVLAKPASFSAELDGTILGRLSPTVDLGGRRHSPQPAAPTVLRQRRRAGTHACGRRNARAGLGAGELALERGERVDEVGRLEAAVALAECRLIPRSSRTSVRRLGYDPDSGTYHAIARSEGLETTPGVVVARVDGPLFFADATGSTRASRS